MPPNSRIGEAVALSATLQPPPEPIEPGGFDFGRQAWFASLGATGYATSKIQSLNDAGALPWDLRAWSGIDALRARVNARIRAALEGETGEIAVALITGARGGISEELNQAMRDSGLAHILSISGLRFTSRASQFGRSRLWCRTVWSSKGRHPRRLQATTQPIRSAIGQQSRRIKINSGGSARRVAPARGLGRVRRYVSRNLGWQLPKR